RRAAGGGSVVQRRVVSVTLGATAVKGGAIGGVERRAAAQALHQIGVGDERSAKGHNVHAAVFDRGFGHGLVVSVVHHPGACAAGVAVDGTQRAVVERALGQLTCAASGAFNQVDIGQA